MINSDAANIADKKIYKVDAINQSIENIVLTKLGSIPGLPEFGTSIHDYLFEQLDPITKMDIEIEIFEAIKKWEPRITNVDVTVEDLYDGIFVKISYQYNLNYYSTSFVAKA